MAKALSYEIGGSNEIKPFSTHFGAIVGLTLLGTNVIDSVLIPMLENYLEFINNSVNLSFLGTAEEKEKVMSALGNALNQWKENHNSSNYSLDIINKYF